MMVGLRYAGIVAPALVTALVQPAACQERDVPRQLAAIVAAQVTAEYGLASQRGAGDVQFEQVTVDTLGSEFPRLRLWRASVWTASHWHPYLLATVGDSTLRLGGFPSPELRFVAGTGRVEIATSDEALRLGKSLARLADPHGAVRLVYSSPGGDPAVTRRWQSVAPSSWPADTVRALSDGSYLVKLTVLSQASWMSGSPWQPIAYSFVLSPDGNLLGWASRVGEPFPVNNAQ